MVEPNHNVRGLLGPRIAGTDCELAAGEVAAEEPHRHVVEVEDAGVVHRVQEGLPGEA